MAPPPNCNRRTPKQRVTFSRLVLGSLQYLCCRSGWTLEDVVKLIRSAVPASVLAACSQAKLGQIVLQSLHYLSEHSSRSAEDVTGVIMTMPRVAALVTNSGFSLGRHVTAALEEEARRGKLTQVGPRFRFADGRYPRAQPAAASASRPAQRKRRHP